MMSPQPAHEHGATAGIDGGDPLNGSSRSDPAGNRQAFRERTIRRIAQRWEEDATEGIYGSEVCQTCGEFGTFMGMWGAVASHRHGVFTGGVDHRHDDREIATAKRRRSRLCEVCRAAVKRDPEAWCRRWWLCPACQETIHREAPGREANDLLHRLSRWRYWRMYSRPTPKW
jgi:hypothetical protein